MVLYTLPDIIKIIKDRGLPTWDLYFYTDRSFITKKVADFYYETEIEDSIKRLVNSVNMPVNAKDLRWFIMLRSNKNANKDKVFETDFVIELKDEATPAPSAQGIQGLPTGYVQPAIAGLGELQNMTNSFNATRENDIYRREAKLDAKEADLITRERACNEKHIEYTIKLSQLEVERNAFNEKVKNTREELKELEDKFKSTSLAAQDGFSQFMMKLLQTWGKDGDLAGLAGTPAINEAPPTEEELRVSAVGESLFALEKDVQIEVCSFAKHVAEQAKAHDLTPEELANAFQPTIAELKEIVKAKN